MRFALRHLAFGSALLCAAVSAEVAPAPSARVHLLKITILSTPVAGHGIGEWGFSALIEADGQRILYDTGGREDVVVRNAKELKVDLSTIPEVVLSHNHPDHVGGLVALRQSVVAGTPTALSRTHVGEGIFLTEIPALKVVRGYNAALRHKPEYEKTGGVFVVHSEPVQIYPGVWLTGPVPRKFEPCGGMNGQMVRPPGWDPIPEDMALVCDTDRGLVVVTGCGHAGVTNIIAYAQTFIRPARIHALIGGLHLNDATDETVSWVIEKLRPFRVENLLGAHCTGFETVDRVRRDLGLDPAHAVVAVVGSVFELGKGIDPDSVAQ